MRLEVFLKEAVTSIEAIPRPRLSRSPTAGTCGRRACREDRAWPPRLPAGTGRGDAAGRSGPLPPPAPPEKKIVTRTKERYTAVQDLRAGGESISAIPRSLTPPCHARPPALRHGTPPGTSGGAPESGPTRTSVLPPLTALVADGDPTVADTPSVPAGPPSSIAVAGWSRTRSTCGPGVVQVEREREPPEQVVGEHDDACSKRPLTREQQVGEAQRPQDLAGHPDRRHRPVLFGKASDLQVEDAVEADHHAEAGEDLRVVLRRHRAKRNSHCGSTTAYRPQPRL